MQRTALLQRRRETPAEVTAEQYGSATRSRRCTTVDVPLAERPRGRHRAPRLWRAERLSLNGASAKFQPGHDVVEHRGECLVRGRRELGVVGEVVAHAEGDLRCDVGELESELFDGADAAVGAVTDEAGGLVVPLGVDAVKGVLRLSG